MTVHYHGTPVNPVARLYELAGRHFCVSHYDPRQVALCHQIGQGVMLDNGAFSKFRSGVPTDWDAFYAWADPWLDCPTTWAVIPDVIDGDEATQNALLLQWPFGEKGAPVWHMHESIDRLLHLTDTWPRVCFGSSGAYWQVLSESWERRADEAWNALTRRHRRTPNIHMLRGMQLSGKRWPFASLDSTDIARNHHIKGNPRAMAERWDVSQCPARYQPVPHDQLELIK